MKKKLLLIFAVVFFAACQQKKEPRAQANQINIGVIDSLSSEVLHEQRKIWVYVPPKTNTPTKYPVLYLLDGDINFISVVGLMHQLSRTNANGTTRCPKMIIVGIPNTDRTRDLTPTHVKAALGDSTWTKTSGGAEKFTRFIGEELIPYIDQKYPTTPHRLLVGHSLGGLFTIHTLIHHPQLFSNYLAIDPSLWWDDRKLIKQSVDILEKEKFDNKSLFVAYANTMPEGMKLSDVAHDTTQATDHIRSILQFIESTKAKTNNGLKFESKYYEADDHSSIPVIAEHDALRSLYSWYALTKIQKYFDPKFRDSTAALVQKINSHFKNASAHFGYVVSPPDDFIDRMGYWFLALGMKENAHALFNMNILNYPEAGHGYDVMGDYYLDEKDTASAIVYYTKALKKENLSLTKEKLLKIQGKK